MFLLWPKELSRVGIRPLLRFPHPPRAGPVLLTLLTLLFPFLPSSRRVLRGSVYLSHWRALLPTLSWCSAHASVSEGAFLMYLWREMCSASTYSSVIFFSVYLIYDFITDYVFIVKLNKNWWEIIRPSEVSILKKVWKTFIVLIFGFSSSVIIWTFRSYTKFSGLESICKHSFYVASVVSDSLWPYRL